MGTLATDFKQVSTELPLVAFIRATLAPVICALCLAVSMLLHEEPFSERYALLAAVSAFVVLQVFGELPLANGHSRLLPGSAILTGWVTAVGILLFLAFVTKLSGLYSRKVVLTWIAVTPFALHSAQELTRHLLHRFVSSSMVARSKVIVGLNEMGHELARQISEDPCRGIVKGYFDDRGDGRLLDAAGLPLLGGVADVADYVKQHSINVVYIALPLSRDPRIVRLLDELRDTTASVYFVPTILPLDLIQARVDRVGEIPVIAVCETPFYGINGVLKRAADLVIASFILLLIWPLLLAIAAGVKRSSPGPVLFKQRRYGLDGKEILVYKFRTMTVCEDGGRIEQAKRGDHRITPFGAFLRKTSLDELPQLFNVLQGTMSLVGPRPHAVAHNEQYRRLIDGYMIRHKVRPGITGWAQVNGFRGETRDVALMQKRVAHDIDYLKHWSLPLDFWIMFKTLFVVLNARNAY